MAMLDGHQGRKESERGSGKETLSQRDASEQKGGQKQRSACAGREKGQCGGRNIGGRPKVGQRMCLAASLSFPGAGLDVACGRRSIKPL